MTSRQRREHFLQDPLWGGCLLGGWNVDGAVEDARPVAAARADTGRSDDRCTAAAAERSCP